MATGQQPNPVVKAFLVCDMIVHDAQSGKKSLIGVFHELRADRFPAVHHALWIYANLTDGRGEYRFEIRLVDVARNTVLGKGKPPPINIGGPLQTTELSAQLRNVQLPGEGTYEFQLHANDQLVATKAIRVMKVETGAAPPPPTGTEPKA